MSNDVYDPRRPLDLVAPEPTSENRFIVCTIRIGGNWIEEQPVCSAAAGLGGRRGRDPGSCSTPASRLSTRSSGREMQHQSSSGNRRQRSEYLCAPANKKCPFKWCLPLFSGSDLVFSTCLTSLTSANHCNHSNNDYCNQMEIQISATETLQDHVTYRSGRVVIHLSVEGDSTWYEHQVLKVPYQIRGSPARQCHLYTKGHFITFDQQRYILEVHLMCIFFSGQVTSFII